MRSDSEVHMISVILASGYMPNVARPTINVVSMTPRLTPRLAQRLIIAERGGLSGRKAMEWFKQKTLIAGVQVSN